MSIYNESHKLSDIYIMIYTNKPNQYEIPYITFHYNENYELLYRLISQNYDYMRMTDYDHLVKMITRIFSTKILNVKYAPDFLYDEWIRIFQDTIISFQLFIKYEWNMLD